MMTMRCTFAVMARSRGLHGHSAGRSLGQLVRGIEFLSWWCFATCRLSKVRSTHGESTYGSATWLMLEQTFNNIDGVPWKEAGCTTELDYTGQTSPILFLSV